jgi:pimeloyl-ACP methyl ester carboxylesterase
MIAAQLKEGEKATLVGFSSGAVAVAEYASRSDDVDHVILDAPLGLVLNKSPYLMRMYSTVKGSLEHAKMLKETGLLSDPRYARFADWVPRQRERGFSELAELLHASAKVNLMPILDDLIRQGKKVTIIAMEDDKLYTIEEIEKSVAKSETGGVKVLVLKGGHTKIGEDPEGLAAFTNDAIQGEMK